MEIVSTASFVTAFLAGVAALFAPCCIGVLLPSYLASIFKTRTKIFLMTFVYYLGLLTVFLPLGLGIASLGAAFSQYHSTIFLIGGLFMLGLGLALVFGKSFALPFHVTPKVTKRTDAWSLYVLGIFSGIATTCCAPVLAGVLALSALPGSWFFGSLYSLIFVTGLVLPLFVIAFFVDKTNIVAKLQTLRRQLHYKLFGHDIHVNLSHLLSGIMFIFIGLFILVVERTGDVANSMYQLKVNLVTAQVTQAVSRVTHNVPEWAWAVLFIGVFALIVRMAWRQAHKKEDES